MYPIEAFIGHESKNVPSRRFIRLENCIAEEASYAKFDHHDRFRDAQRMQKEVKIRHSWLFLTPATKANTHICKSLGSLCNYFLSRTQSVS